jgi:hypothetical protein
MTIKTGIIEYQRVPGSRTSSFAICAALAGIIGVPAITIVQNWLIDLPQGGYSSPSFFLLTYLVWISPGATAGVLLNAVALGRIKASHGSLRGLRLGKIGICCSVICYLILIPICTPAISIGYGSHR